MRDEGFSLRRAVSADGAGLLRVHRAAILQLGAAAYSRAETESWAAGLVAEGYGQAMFEAEESFWVAVDPAARIVGFASHCQEEVMALFVHPDWTRRGVASALLRQVEAEIAAEGHDTIFLDASLAGLSFYRRQGYAELGPKDWRTRGGLVIAMRAMSKALDGAAVP